MAGEMVPRDRDEAGIVYRESLSGTEVVRQAETTIAMMAAQQKAMIEARLVVALRQGRNYEKLRLVVGDLCKNPKFAETAMYLKPISRTPQGWNMLPMRDRLRSELLKRDRNRAAQRGDDNEQEWPMGFSIRFIESAIAEAGHIDVNATVIWEDDEKRITKVDVCDLVKNNSWSRTVVTKKTVERRRLGKDQEPLFTRHNSFGDLLYIVEATEAEVLQSEAAAVSKSVRTMGERIFPGHLKLEWRQILENTLLNEAAQDPEGKRKEIIDAFHGIGVEPENLAKYLEHGVELLQPAEYLSLKVIYASIRSGEVKWSDVLQAKFGPGEGEEETKGAKGLKDKLEKRVADMKRESATTAPPSAAPATAAPPAPPEPAPTETPAQQPSASQADPLPQGAPQEQAPEPDVFADKPAASRLTYTGPLSLPERSLKTYGEAAGFPALPDVFDVKAGLEVYFIEGDKRKRLRAEEDSWKLVSAEDYTRAPAPAAAPAHGPQAVPDPKEKYKFGQKGAGK